MNDSALDRRLARTVVAVVLLSLLLPLAGCSSKYPELRMDGQKAMIGGSYGAARWFFDEADSIRPRDIQNLNDLGVCSLLAAREQFTEMNHAAAMRELDNATAYFSRAIEVHPGHQASLEGKNRALELKGQFDEALEHAEWAARFVGPSARQQLFLARELEERGDVDGAFLRYQQAVAMEPNSAKAHAGFAKFLLRHDKEASAIGHLQAAYRLDPSDKWVVDQLVNRSALPPLAPVRQPEGPG